MSPQQFSKARHIFDAALDLPEAEREEYVREACAGDEELAVLVVKLLRQQDDSEGPNILPTQPLYSLQRGEVLAGRFRIASFLGRGGMGEVYAADDLELGSKVALKTLRPDLLQDPEFLGRFRREVQLARQVTHPNVCRIFDVGRDRNRVFLTMEYLEGQSLSEYLAAAGPLNRDAALPLVRQMADGLMALHNCGIVHRDFKPGNVMVVRSTSGSPRAVISDFGLARALEAETITNLSRAGQIMGTPDYMAPEQLIGQTVTPAADVYALGLVMHEMVTGKKAFPGGRALGVDRQTPVRLDAAGFPPVWEQVIVQCLARDPELRPSAAEVSAAIAGVTPLPVRRERRGKRLLIWAAVACMVVALFVAGMRLGERQSGAGRQHVALLPLTVLGDEADVRVFGLGLVETVTSRLSQYDGTTNQPLLVVPASEVRSQEAKNAGDAKRKFGVTTAVEGTLQTQADRVRLLLTVIDTASMRQVETIVVEDQRSNSMRIQDAAVSKLANVLNLRLQPRYAKEQQAWSTLAPGAYEYYLQGRGYLQRADQTQSLDAAITMFQRALAADETFAPAHSGLGEAYLGKYALTMEPALMEKALASAARGLQLNPHMAETQISMGRVHLGTGRYAEARADFDKAIEIDPRSNEANQGLATAYWRLNDFDRAEATFLKAISLRPGDWTGYKQLGVYYLQRGEPAKAAEQFRRVVDLSPDNAQGYVNLGASHQLQWNLTEAEKIYQKALELDPKRLSTLSNLGKVLLDNGKYNRAIEMFGRALEISKRSYLLWGNLGMAHLQAGNRAKANEALTEALRLIDSELMVNPNRVELHSRLGFYRAYLGRKDYEEPLERALRMEPGNTNTIVRVAETMAYVGKRDRAIALMRDALARGYSDSALRRSLQLRDLVPDATRKQ